MALAVILVSLCCLSSVVVLSACVLASRSDQSEQRPAHHRVDGPESVTEDAA